MSGSMEKKQEDCGSRPPATTKPKELTEYLREYNKRMKRLHREARGENTESPPEADYE